MSVSANPELSASSVNFASMEGSPRSAPGQQQQLDGDYWVARWNNKETNWRNRERDAKPFQSNAKALLRAISESAPSDSDAAAGLSAVRAMFEGRTVFVPLCGDTLALGFWAKEVGCRVIGVDVMERALRDAAAEQFADRKVEESAADKRGLKRLDLLPAAAGEGPVTLYCGDAFEMLEHWGEYLADIDVWYDRAALVALDPDTQRERYVKCMLDVLQVHSGEKLAAKHPYFGGYQGDEGLRRHRVAFLNVIERPKREAVVNNGPPFNVSTDEVFKMFSAAEGDCVRFVVESGAGDRSILGGEVSESVPFALLVDACYTIVSRRV